ncbi:uncharacterized protein LOC106169783 [Lingula anatina]|uniref:Uncharacterized protein LOC106169783 n=1 Tax=Lingula anatina TaxID=7574 RepID=A0A2R2MTT1_LINAN|nr:uncharacterized protein LOC106169783 [Lingula anatina]|eukprot:XP_023933649.1 uncharacterized protein LOC106169783 [Lingula anatina]
MKEPPLYFQDLCSWDSAPIFVGVHQHPVTEVYLEDISDHVWTLSEDVRRYYVKKIAKCNGWDDSDFIKSVDTFLEENVKTDGPEVDLEGEELDTDEDESETDDENLEEERTGYSNLREKIFSDHGVLHESSVKKRSYALERIVVSLIQKYLKPGETLVVFLDGMLSIEKLGDALGEFEPNPPAEWPVDHLRVIVLHSQIPPEDQGDAFKAPEANCGHVVLTTNIAENAVTVPQVRVVIDLGWKRQPVYNVTSRLTTLQRTHISKASAKQRKGRTGRVFEKGNLVIRLYTRKLYRELENFDKPDIQTAPLEKLVLKARQAATNAFPDLRSKEILQDTIEPPDISNIDDGIKVLWENGAFTENSDRSSITMLGHLAMQLPVDLILSRLVLYGIVFGCAVEGIILAAALASKDPFMMPTKKVIKNTEEFAKSLRRSEKSRRKFDGGACSEPIALLNLFKKWLEWIYDEKGRMIVDTVSIWDIKKEFCENNAVSLNRLNAYERVITRLASSVLKYVSDQSIACKIRALVFFISDTREVDNPRVTSQTDFFRPSDLFISSDQLDLKALLLAALHPAFLVGETMNKLHYVKTDVYPFKEYTNLETKMKANKMDMKRTIFVPAKPTVYNKNDECKLRAIEKLAKLCIFSQQTLPELKPAEKGSLFIQYKGAEPVESRIFHDIMKDAHSLFKFGEGRQSSIFPGEKRRITLEQPMHPYRIHWSVLSIRGTDMMSPEQREYPCTGYPDWRAPFASACDLDQRTYLAVAENFINWKQSVGFINGMTILPQDEGNMLTLCLILTFQPKHFSTRFIVDIWRQRITHLELFRHRFAIPEASELTEEILDHINQFRKDLSEAFCADLKNQGLSEFCSMERFLTRLKQLMEKEKHRSRSKLSKLVQAIREAIDAETFRQLPDKFKLLGALKDKETPSIDDIIKQMTQGTDYEESSQDLDYRYNVEIAIKAMIPSETQDEELTYLPPYNCEVFSMAYLKQQKDQQDADNNMAYSKITARAAGPDYFEFTDSDTSDETSSDGEEWEFMDVKGERDETSVEDKPIPEQKKDDSFPYHPVLTATSFKRRHRKRKDSVSESVPVNIPGVDVVPQLVQHDIDGITAALDIFVDMCQGLPTPKPAYVRNFMGNRHYQVLGLRLREEQLAAVIQYCDKYKVEEGGDMGPVVCEKS